MSASATAGRLRTDLASLDPDTLDFILSDWQVWARDDQLPPQSAASGAEWRVWLILGGRGAGKTRAGAEWVRAKALGTPPLGRERATRIALVGETLADVRRVMIEGVSGLLATTRLTNARSWKFQNRNWSGRAGRSRRCSRPKIPTASADRSSMRHGVRPSSGQSWREQG